MDNPQSVDYIPTKECHSHRAEPELAEVATINNNENCPPHSPDAESPNGKRPLPKAPLIDLTNSPLTHQPCPSSCGEETPSKKPPVIPSSSPTRLLHFLDQAEAEIKGVIETGKINMTDAATQTYYYDETTVALTEENKRLKNEITSLEEERDQLKSSKLTADSLSGDDKKTKFLTGLPSHFVFITLFTFISPFVKAAKTSLTLKDEFLLVLMKLGLNLKDQDLGYRFNISQSTVNAIFTKWINAMYFRTKNLILFPDKETVLQIIPPVFKKHFPNLRCIIDCSEVLRVHTKAHELPCEISNVFQVQKAQYN